jgi:enoyl-CoA hydratase/carnithine racemase
MFEYKHLTINRDHSGLWTATLSNPPINLLEPQTITELQALMSEVETDPSVKVLVFQSSDPDFFIAHFDTAKAAGSNMQSAGPTGYMSWIDFVLRLSKAPVISIAKIRGRARGVGNEFILACDLRFASRQNAIFANPEIGVGLVAGGGAMEWLPRIVGRSRALEIVLSGDDYGADMAERYGWVNRALDDTELDAFVDGLAARLASFDRDVLGAVKGQINRIGVPTGPEIQSSTRLFFGGLSTPNAQARRAKLAPMGYGVRSDLEMHFGSFLASLTP